jgi:hypothetical protein
VVARKETTMATTGMRRKGAKYWKKVFKGQNQSGLSVSKYCERIKESRYRFYYWKQKLAEDETRKSHGSGSGFIELPVFRTDIPSQPIRIHIGSFVLEVEESASSESIARSARILQSLVAESA